LHLKNEEDESVKLRGAIDPIFVMATYRVR